jgi:hypothetical protein
MYSIIECPNGDLLACWFHGSGERTADDVVIQDAWLQKVSKKVESCFFYGRYAWLPKNYSIYKIKQQALI